MRLHGLGLFKTYILMSNLHINMRKTEKSKTVVISRNTDIHFILTNAF